MKYLGIGCAARDRTEGIKLNCCAKQDVLQRSFGNMIFCIAYETIKNHNQNRGKTQETIRNTEKTSWKKYPPGIPMGNFHISWNIARTGHQSRNQQLDLYSSPAAASNRQKTVKGRELNSHCPWRTYHRKGRTQNNPYAKPLTCDSLFGKNTDIDDANPSKIRQTGSLPCRPHQHRDHVPLAHKQRARMILDLSVDSATISGRSQAVRRAISF